MKLCDLLKNCDLIKSTFQESFDPLPIPITLKFKLSEMAQYASMAYCPPEKLKSFTCSKCTLESFEIPVINNNNTCSLSWYIGLHHSQQRLILGFRGSGSVSHWRTNLTPTLVDLYESNESVSDEAMEAQVHRGYKECYTSAHSSIETMLNRYQYQYPTYHLVIVGHSLGGAMATLASAYIKASKEIFTFGAPRVGNEAFNKQVIGNLYRLVNYTDPIPHLPPLSKGYSHGGLEIWANRKGELVSCHQINGEDTNCANSLSSLFHSKNRISKHLHFLNATFGKCLD